MKKLLSLAVLAGLATTANAVHLSEDGTGSVLLFPYYTARNDLTTAVSIVNTTNETKAVKVRFYEGRNSWEVLDFNLYLSPYDVWTGAMTDAGNGVATLVTEDNSCTIPEIGEGKNTSTNFMKYGIGHDPGANQPTVAAGASMESRTFEGHFDVIEMGELDTSTAFGLKMANYIEHGSDGVPGDCDKLRSEFSNGNGQWEDVNATYTTSNVGFKVQPAAGGLFGTATLVNAESGTATAYEATAIDNYFQMPVHNTPGNDFPSVAGLMQSENSDANSLFVAASSVSWVNYTTGGVSSTWDSPAKALSALLMTNRVANEYNIADSMLGATDWVITFPTKHYFTNASSIDANYKYALGQYGALARDAYEIDGVNDNEGVNYIAPFASDYAVPVEAFYVYDREEGALQTADISPADPEQPKLIFETNVLEFSDDRNIFASQLVNDSWRGDYNSDSLPDYGFARLQLDENSMTSEDGAVYNGFPLIGFATTKITNASTLANYTVSRDHAVGQLISGATTAAE